MLFRSPIYFIFDSQEMDHLVFRNEEIIPEELAEATLVRGDVLGRLAVVQLLCTWRLAPIWESLHRIEKKYT